MMTIWSSTTSCSNIRNRNSNGNSAWRGMIRRRTFLIKQIWSCRPIVPCFSSKSGIRVWQILKRRLALRPSSVFNFRKFLRAQCSCNLLFLSRKKGTEFPWGPQDVTEDETLQGTPYWYNIDPPNVVDCFISGRIFNDLCSEVKNMGKRAGSNTNKWLSYTHKPSFYPDPKTRGNRVAQYTLFLFTHARKSARGITVDKLIVYYFPVSTFFNWLPECCQTLLGVLGGGNPTSAFPGKGSNILMIVLTFSVPTISRYRRSCNILVVQVFRLY